MIIPGIMAAKRRPGAPLPPEPAVWERNGAGLGTGYNITFDASLSTWYRASGAAVYASTNDGDEWELRGSLSPSYYTERGPMLGQKCMQSFEGVLIAAGIRFDNQLLGVSRSEDGGMTFDNVVVPVTSNATNCLVPLGSGVWLLGVIAEGDDLIYYRSVDDGLTWDEISLPLTWATPDSGLPGYVSLISADVQGTTVLATVGRTVNSSYTKSKILKSTDGGATFTVIKESSEGGSGGLNDKGPGVIRSYGPGKWLTLVSYVGNNYTQGDVTVPPFGWRSEDDGATWVSINLLTKDPPTETPRMFPISYLNFIGSRWLAFASMNTSFGYRSYGYYDSTDNGESWTWKTGRIESLFSPIWGGGRPTTHSADVNKATGTWIISGGSYDGVSYVARAKGFPE